MKSFDVFISANNKDYKIAEQVYDFLVEKNLHVFFCERTLQQLGNANFSKEIDKAIEQAKHMVVITSSLENVESGWVEAEWRGFINEQNSKKKTGNLVTILVGRLVPNQLPLGLRQKTILSYDKSGLDKLLSYVTAGEQNPQSLTKIQQNGKSKVKRLFGTSVFIIGIAVTVLCLLVGVYLSQSNNENKKYDSKGLQNPPEAPASPSKNNIDSSGSTIPASQTEENQEKNKREEEAGRAIKAALTEKRLAEEQAEKTAREKKVIEAELAAAEAKQKADAEETARLAAQIQKQNLDKAAEQRKNVNPSAQSPPSQVPRTKRCVKTA